MCERSCRRPPRHVVGRVRRRRLGRRSARARRQVAALEPHQQQRDRRRGHALDAAGLADGLGLVLVELLLHFLGQAAHLRIVERHRQTGRLGLSLLGDLFLLVLDGGDAFCQILFLLLVDVQLLVERFFLLLEAAFLRPERIARVDAEAADAAFITRNFVDTALPVHAVSYVADLPRKHRREHAGQAQPQHLTEPRLDALIAGAQSEVLLQTPYLVLSKPARRLFQDLRKREQPPRVVVSTNSLAATDNPIVYAMAYKYKRRNLRVLGFDIHEYKPFPLDAPVDPANLLPVPGDGGTSSQRNPLLGASAAGSNVRVSGSGRRASADGSEVEREVLRTETRPSFLGSKAVNRPLPVTREGARMGLHAKSLVVDRRIGVIGTHNFDPRSENYNTEGAVIIDDPAFAEALAQSILRDTHPDNAWVVAPREKPPVLSGLNYSIGKASEALPVLDFWPWRYATNYQFRPGPSCPAPLSRHAPDFHDCYVPVGDFPEVAVGPKWVLVRMLTAFGAGLVPIL